MTGTVGLAFSFYPVYVFLAHSFNHHVLNKAGWSHCLDKYNDSMLNYFFFHGLHKTKLIFQIEIFDKEVNYFKCKLFIDSIKEFW